MQKSPWEVPQKRAELKPYTTLYTLDEFEKQTLQEFLDGPQVEIFYDLNDETDYAVSHMVGDRLAIARISECVTINGVRWHLVPGKNVIPAPVYEFLKQCPEQRSRLSSPKPNQFGNLGNFQYRGF